MKIFNKKLILSFTILVIFSLSVVLTNVMQPLISQKLLDLTLSGDYSALPVQFLNLFIAIVILLVFELGRKLTAANYKKNLLNAFRLGILKGLLSKRLEDFQLLNNQKYISLFNNDLREITDDYYMNFTDILFNTIALIVYATTLFRLNIIMAIIVIATNILPILAPLLFRKSLQLKKEAYLESLKAYNVKLGDVVNGFALIKVHRLKVIMETLLKKTSKDSTDREKEFNYLSEISNMLVGFLSFANYFCIILAGVYLMKENQLSAGGLLAAIQVSELLVGPTVNITCQMNTFNAIKVLKQQVFKEYATVGEPGELFENPEEIEKIEVKDLCFKYGEIQALEAINLTFEKGKKYLIYGHSGSGKSTLFKVLSKMNNNYTGGVFVNGEALSDTSESDYFSRIGIVYQTPFIFNDTLWNNMTLFKDYNEQAVESVIDELELHRIKGDIFNGKIFKDSENNLSGGEKQKLSHARILLEGKLFIFLDEATSAIDAKSSFKIESDLLNRQDVTLINIEHKINPELVSFYDEIICLDSGRVRCILRTMDEKNSLFNT